MYSMCVRVCYVLKSPSVRTLQASEHIERRQLYLTGRIEFLYCHFPFMETFTSLHHHNHEAVEVSIITAFLVSYPVARGWRHSLHADWPALFMVYTVAKSLTESRWRNMMCIINILYSISTARKYNFQFPHYPT